MSHIHERIDFTAEVLVVYKNKVLLRKHDKYDKWLGVGGHIELDEDPVQAAIREVKEEVGLDVSIIGEAVDFGSKDFRDLPTPRFLNRHRINDSHEHVTMGYFGISSTDQISQGKTEVSPGCHWFTAAELDDPQYGLQEDIKYYAKRALEAVTSR